MKRFPEILIMAILCVGALSLGACTSMERTPAASYGPQPLAGNMAEYRLAPGDTVSVIVFNDETLTGEFMLDKRGFITMPLVGDIRAQGLTKSSLQDEIEKSLVEGQYLKEPHISVDLKSLQPFYILGEVKNPGSYPYQPSLDVFKAIALAGGYTPRAVKGKVIIGRDSASGKEKIHATEDTPILPGDSITVRQRIF
jgi:polysaccharide export outer membrane protein